MSRVWRCFSFIFLPDGYPDTVADEYFSYQVWDTIQQVVMFTNSNLAQLAVFGFHGVGRASASVTMAVVLTVSRDLVGHHASLALSFPSAAALYASRVSVFRMVAEALNALAIFMDIGAFESGMVWLFWGARLLQSLYSVISGVVRSCILQHFAKNNNNRDIVLKEGNQDKGGKVLGIVCGVIVLHFVTSMGGSNSDSTLRAMSALCIVLGVVHVLTNVGAVWALRVPPATFVLQDTESEKHVAWVEGKTFDASIEKASDSQAHAFKLGNIPGGKKALMTLSGAYVDVQGRCSEDPIAAQYTEDNGTHFVSVAGATYRAIPQARVAGVTGEQGSCTTMFVPPGFPATTPVGYSQLISYDVIGHLTDMPKSVLELLLYWRLVYGVGDSDKSPIFATYLSIYAVAIHTMASLVSGLPVFADRYNTQMYFMSSLVGRAGDIIYVGAALVPLHWWFPLVALARCAQAWSGVVSTVVWAECDRICASHPKVELAHITNTAGNRRFILTLLSGLLCMLYAYHLSDSDEVAQPSAESCVIAYSLLLCLNLFSAWGQSVTMEKLISGAGFSARAVSASPSHEEAFSPRDDLHSPRPDESERHVQASAALMAHGPSERRGPLAGGWTAGLKTCALTLLPVLGEAAFFAGLVKTLSSVKSQLEPCTERCLQFKLVGDDSFIPSTGLWPFVLQNGDPHGTIADACERFGGSNCDRMPDAQKCWDEAANTCEHHSVRDKVQNPLARSRTGLGFIISVALQSVFTLLADSGLLMGIIGAADAVVLHVCSTLAMAAMAAFALAWASGAMELFLSPIQTGPDVCGCYFRMGDLPSMLALSLPLVLVIRLRTKLVLTMRAAIMEGGFLSTVTYHVPFDFIRDAGVDARQTGCLLGVRGLGQVLKQACERADEARSLCSMTFAKRMAKDSSWISVIAILLPLLGASCNLIYRLVDLAFVVLQSVFSVDLPGSSSASLALLGVYGMIFLQGVMAAYFLTETWRLYYILSIQLGDFPGDTSHIQAELAEAHPELLWRFCTPRDETASGRRHSSAECDYVELTCARESADSAEFEGKRL